MDFKSLITSVQMSIELARLKSHDEYDINEVFEELETYLINILDQQNTKKGE